MGSSGKVVNLVVGKEVTAIGSQFQKSYIGTPTAKLSLTLEEGSKLSSVGDNAFKDNTFFVSIDLSNAGDVSYGINAFDGVANLTEFSSNAGKAVLKSLSFANLKKLEKLNWNASTTDLGWTPPTLSVNYRYNIANNASTVAHDLANPSMTAGYVWNLTHYAISKVNYSAASTSHNSNLVYDFPATAVSDHPFYNLGSQTSAGTAIAFSNANSIDSYMFTSGIQMVETRDTSVPVVRTITSTPYYKDSPSIPLRVSTYFYNSSNAWAYQQATISNTTTTMNTTVTIIPGVKKQYATNIKINSIQTGADDNLKTVGSNVIGSINYDLSKYSNSAIVTSHAFSGKAYTASKPAEITSSLPWIVFRWDNNSGYYYNYQVIYWMTGSAYNSMTGNWLGGWNYSHGGSGRLSYYGFANAASGKVGLTNTIGSTVTVKLADHGLTGDYSWTVSCTPILSDESYSDADKSLSSGISYVLLNSLATSSTISDYCFAGEDSLATVYLGAGVATIEHNAFFSKKNPVGTMYIYGHDSSSAVAQQDGIKTNNSYAITWLPDAKDLGRYINHYQIGDAVTAYLFEQVDGTYVINLVGTGATYDTYTDTNTPGWVSDYRTKVSKVIVDDTVTSVGPYLFYGHTALTSVQFGSGLTSIGAHAFGNCTGLDTFTVPATLTSVGERILEGAAVKTVYYNANTEDAYHSMSGCDANEIILGANVTKIGDGTLGDISGDFFVEAGEALNIQKRASHTEKQNPHRKIEV